jgi:hypothetical protein
VVGIGAGDDVPFAVVHGGEATPHVAPLVAFFRDESGAEAVHGDAVVPFAVAGVIDHPPAGRTAHDDALTSRRHIEHSGPVIVVGVAGAWIDIASFDQFAVRTHAGISDQFALIGPAKPFLQRVPDIVHRRHEHQVPAILNRARVATAEHDVSREVRDVVRQVVPPAEVPVLQRRRERDVLAGDGCDRYVLRLVSLPVAGGVGPCKQQYVSDLPPVRHGRH